MKKIIIAYWRGTKFNNLDYEHNQEFDYSLDLLHIIIDEILLEKYFVMLQPSDDNIIVWINNGKFTQR